MNKYKENDDGTVATNYGKATYTDKKILNPYEKVTNKYEYVRTRFARPVRFNLDPIPFRAKETTRLELLKDRLLKQLLNTAENAGQNIALRRAANDAAALAWVTEYPLLVFPALLEEKARTALIQYRRQARIRQATQNIALKAA
jgi:hypothetical protein